MTIVKALRQLVKATLLVEFNEMQLTIALESNQENHTVTHNGHILKVKEVRKMKLHVGNLSSSPSYVKDGCKHAIGESFEA